ncbi:MAG TPA: DUF819 family protein [Bacteroidales bacterium]|nr:DUF819 family protein [Bacteroidales bacterium]HRR92488.1 DUF819 family protein [Bacteroidales bacterium]HRT88530.1 DUF819 family protein [Bacteroidales bacterium]
MNVRIVLMLVFFVVTPIIVIILEQKFKMVRKLGGVLICYILGALVGNLGLLPAGAEVYQDWFTKLAVPLALPLILFSMDVKKWLKMAGSTISSLLLGLFTVVLFIFIGYWIFKDSIPDSWKVAGMLSAVYTGGTPNMAAMKTALNVDNELYLMTHTYEVALGAIYLIFILSVGQRVFLMWLPPFRKPDTGSVTVAESSIEGEFESYDGYFRKKTLLPVLGAFGLSVLIFAVSYGVSMLFPADFSTAATILLITTLGIAASFVPRIKNIQKTFQTGMYFILIFSLVVSSMADIRKLVNISFDLFWYVGLAMFGSHLLHAFLARFFKIDADTVIISGSALICSPPFVPLVAGALKNRDVILTGLIVGIVGYAVGNYLGVSIAYLLR